MSMRARALQAIVRRRLRSYPAAGLVGPRQCGKTTLARQLGGRYFDLQREADRLQLDVEWPDLETGHDLVVLDEAQDWPAIFPRLRSAIDRDRRRNGRFLLLGSVSPSLMTHVSESLAGRLAIVPLSPFTIAELPRVPLRRLWVRGGYPDGGVLDEGRFPRWQRDYLTLLAQRDLPHWGLPAKPQVTERLFRMLASVNGQIWNASQLGQSLGLSYHTVNSYLDYLEGAFLIRRLQPFAANVRKRLVKSPRVYWRDSGLLHALLGLDDETALLAQPWVGASWEGFVIGEVLELLAQRDRAVDASYFRTSDGHEVDMVLDFGPTRWAIEIKLTSSPSASDLSRLNAVADLIDADVRILISQTSRPVSNGREISCNLQWFARHVLPGVAKAATAHEPRRRPGGREPRRPS